MPKPTIRRTFSLHSRGKRTRTKPFILVRARILRVISSLPCSCVHDISWYSVKPTGVVFQPSLENARPLCLLGRRMIRLDFARPFWDVIDSKPWVITNWHELTHLSHKNTNHSWLVKKHLQKPIGLTVLADGLTVLAVAFLVQVWTAKWRRRRCRDKWAQRASSCSCSARCFSPQQKHAENLQTPKGCDHFETGKMERGTLF